MIRLRPISIAPTIWAVLFAASFSSAAEADCAQWDVGGRWRLNQDNGFWVDLNIQQAGNVLSGTATYISQQPGAYGAKRFSEGTIEGSVNGEDISFIAHWKFISSVETGEYRGKISPQGWLRGDTRDWNKASSTAKWNSIDRTAGCKVAVAPPPPPNPAEVPNKPVKKLGKRLPGTSTTSTLPQSAMATVKGDVDVYDVPGGEGTVINMLRKGTRVTVAKCQDQWCNVTGSGWVYQDFLTF